MSPTAILLVLTAAVLHACWNFGTRKSRGNLPVLWLSLMVAGLAYLPISVWASWGRPITLAGVVYIVSTAVLHAIYFPLLGAAYKHGDISLVYPIARGTGVGLTGIVAFAMGVDPFGIAPAAAIACVCLGIFLISRPPEAVQPLGDHAGAAHQEASSRHHRSSLLMAMGVGVTIMIYSIADKLAVSSQALAGIPAGDLPPQVYINAQFLGAAICMTPYVLRRASMADLRRCWATQKRYVLAIGPFSLATYLLILMAYQLGPVSSVVAMREFAVVIGSIMGFVLLKERVTAWRVCGIGLVVAGIVLLKIT